MTQSTPSAWKSQLKTIIESMTAVYIATFCIGLFFLHHGENWIIPAIFLGILYLFVFVISLKRILARLPMASIMIAAPTLPLIYILMVLSLLPILQLFK